MNRFAKIWWTAKGVNWRNLPRRLFQTYRMRSGVLRARLDPAMFSQRVFERQCAAYLPDPMNAWRCAAALLPSASADDLRQAAPNDTWSETTLPMLVAALQGDYPFFSHWTGKLGWPPDFNLDPVSNARWPVNVHWLDPARRPTTDVKLVWEASRLTLCVHLARAYARDGSARWAEAFWTLLDAWIAQNPPELSINWSCGQEAAMRLMAVTLGVSATLSSSEATPQRLLAAMRLVWQTGAHLRTNINQALMQGNNHGFSEAAGLWTCGILFPQFETARHWQQYAMRVLARESRRQIYDDGSFVQHSTNYHRVMLDDLLWVASISRRATQPLPSAVEDGMKRASRWLWEMLDPIIGRTPNYGPNDGANVLPLSCCDYLDYRPTMQAAWTLLHGTRCIEPGPWDEKALWLAGPDALQAPLDRPPRQPLTRLDTGGYYILRGDRSWLMTRCHTYRHRPTQADMLHADIWADGINILRDGGSFLYNCEEPWRSWFNSTAAHNTIQVGRRDQMIKGPRFLWFRWTRSRLINCGSQDALHWFEGEHYGYADLPGRPVHRRRIEQHDDGYRIVDTVRGTGRQPVALRWRLCPGAWTQSPDGWTAQVGKMIVALRVTTHQPCEQRILDGQADSAVEGWESLYYGRRTPAPTVVCECVAELPIVFETAVTIRR